MEQNIFCNIFLITVATDGLVFSQDMLNVLFTLNAATKTVCAVHT